MAREEDLTDQQFDELCQHYAPSTYLHRRSECAAPAVQGSTILTITYENGFPEFSGDNDAEEETGSDSGTDTADAETDEDDSDDETTQAEETDIGSDAPTAETDTDTD
jgi:hypothetical protein